MHSYPLRELYMSTECGDEAGQIEPDAVQAVAGHLYRSRAHRPRRADDVRPGLPMPGRGHPLSALFSTSARLRSVHGGTGAGSFGVCLQVPAMSASIGHTVPAYDGAAGALVSGRATRPLYAQNDYGCRGFFWAEGAALDRAAPVAGVFRLVEVSEAGGVRAV